MLTTSISEGQHGFYPAVQGSNLCIDKLQSSQQIKNGHLDERYQEKPRTLGEGNTYQYKRDILHQYTTFALH